MIGETIYHYRIIEKIGEGGMGVVYRAEDIKLRRTVALKFLSRTAVIHGSTRERIMKEARAAASLDHQNICAIHEIEELDDKLFIVMAYCEGSTLGSMLRAEKPGLEKILDILIQIADGLCAAHEQGIVHRDIKPSNVIVSSRGRVKIMDFGLAKRSGAETKSMTMVGAGTLAYMSPEQVRGDDVDHRSDIWSLGVLMYQMLAGRRPFDGDYDASVLYSIVNEPHKPVRELEPETPPQIDAIVDKAIAKSPGDRYGTMEQMRNDLIQARNLIFGEPETTVTGKGFFYSGRYIFGWKLTSVLALSVSAVLLFFIIRYIIPGGDGGRIGPDGTKTAEAEVLSGPAPLSEADILYERGMTLYTSGNQPRGMRLIEHALEIDPEHFESLKRLAIFYDWSGDFRKASELIDRARNIAHRRGSTTDLLACNAIASKVLHQWDLAVKFYQDLYEADQDDVSIPIQIGYILSKYVGDYKAALEYFDLYFQIDPDNVSSRHGQAYNYTGTALLYSGDFDGAIEAYGKYQLEAPGSPDPVTSMANAHLFAGNYDEAYRLYSSLLELNDPGFTVYEGLGRTCIETGRLREANEHFHRYLGAVSSRKHKVGGHLQLARIYLIQKNEQSFTREMEKIYDIDPESARACWLRGVRSITIDNDVDKARMELIRMKALNEKPFAYDETARHEHLRGLILLADGRTLGALEALAESARRSPREFLYFGREYARVLLLAGRIEEAVAEGLALSRYNPNDPALLMLLCRANLLDGDEVSAEAYYSMVLDILQGADEDFLPLIEFKAQFEEEKSI